MQLISKGRYIPSWLRDSQQRNNNQTGAQRPRTDGRSVTYQRGSQAQVLQTAQDQMGSYAIALMGMAPRCMLTPSMPEESYQNVWIVDSGATHHMTGDESLFVPGSLSQTNSNVTFGNNASLNATKVGSVKIADNCFLTKVLYVPGMDISLLSVTMIEDAGVTHHQDTISGWTFKAGEDVVFQAKRVGRLYCVPFADTSDNNNNENGSVYFCINPYGNELPKCFNCNMEFCICDVEEQSIHSNSNNIILTTMTNDLLLQNTLSAKCASKFWHVTVG